METLDHAVVLEPLGAFLRDQAHRRSRQRARVAGSGRGRRLAAGSAWRLSKPRPCSLSISAAILGWEIITVSAIWRWDAPGLAEISDSTANSDGLRSSASMCFA